MPPAAGAGANGVQSLPPVGRSQRWKWSKVWVREYATLVDEAGPELPEPAAMPVLGLLGLLRAAGIPASPWGPVQGGLIRPS